MEPDVLRRRTQLGHFPATWTHAERASARRVRSWLGGGAIVGALFAAGACARPYDSESMIDLPARSGPSNDSGADVSVEDPSNDRDASDDAAAPEVESDAGDAGDAGIDAGPCAAKPDGHRWGTKSGERCCDGKAVVLNTTTNCGACGLACAAGRSCSQESPGAWLCKGCTTDAECRASVGGNATCYQTYCDCQDACRGGAQCMVVTGHNYCAYP